MQSSTAAAFNFSAPDLPVFRASMLERSAPARCWGFDNLVGILSELSEEVPSGAVSLVAEIIREAQAQREPVAWVCGPDSVFFPPDLARQGIDVPSIAVIRAGGEKESLVAAEWLVRSGALGLVVVDAASGLGAAPGAGPGWNVNDASLGRLLKLAERGQSAVVFLTRKRPEDPSLCSRISLRGCVRRSGQGPFTPGPFTVMISTGKDKRSATPSRVSRQYDGPPGMY